MPTLLLFLLFSTLAGLYYRKEIFLQFFKITTPFWEKNRTIGKIFGVQYRDSSTWKTNRDHSGLLVFNPKALAKVTGIEIDLGDLDFIKSFRKRQRSPIAEFKIDLQPGRRSLRELEQEIMGVWHDQLKHCYELPIEDEDDELVLGFMKDVRHGIATKSWVGQILSRTYDAYVSKRDLALSRKKAIQKMSREEKVLYFVPFLTTVDTFMICLAYQTYGDNLSDFFDRVPIKFAPMYEDKTPVIVTLTNNHQNNPGNSVFGPTGVICPGSNVTTAILNAIKEFCNNHSWEIEGTPTQQNKMISGISNMEDVYITIH